MDVHGKVQVGLRRREDGEVLQLCVEGPLNFVGGVWEAGLDEEIGNIIRDVVDVVEVGRCRVAQRRSLTLDDEEGLSLGGGGKSRIGLRDREDELVGPFFERVLELELVPGFSARLGGRYAEQPFPFGRKTLLCGSAGLSTLLEAPEGVRTGARDGWGKGRRRTLHVVVVVILLRIAEVGNWNGRQHPVLVVEVSLRSAATWRTADGSDDGSPGLMRDEGRSRCGNGSGRCSARSSGETGRRGCRQADGRRPGAQGTHRWTSHVVGG